MLIAKIEIRVNNLGGLPSDRQETKYFKSLEGAYKWLVENNYSRIYDAVINEESSPWEHETWVTPYETDPAYEGKYQNEAALKVHQTED